MKSNFLQTFLLTADSGSMAEAARKLNISPATVAQQIGSLETELGIKLVTRVGKAVRPTEAGYRVLDQSRRLLQELDKIKALANFGEINGQLRLGSINTALVSLMPQVLRQLLRTYPGLTFHITSALSSELFNAVGHGEVDAAIVLYPQFELPKTLAWRLLREEKMILIAPQEFADQEPHELLLTKPFIRYDRKQWGGQQVACYLKKADIVPREYIELSHLAAIANLVSQGLGVALVPDTVMSPSITSRIARMKLPLDTRPRRLGVLWQRSSMREKLIKIFVDQAVSFCNSKAPTD
jgi:DNA-binding transcriptional LysR family regulator